MGTTDDAGDCDNKRRDDRVGDFFDWDVCLRGRSCFVEDLIKVLGVEFGEFKVGFGGCFFGCGGRRGLMVVEFQVNILSAGLVSAWMDGKILRFNRATGG